MSVRLGADALATDDRGWAYNLAIFRIVFLGGAVLPFAWAVVRWAERILPGLPPDAWRPISFYALLPREVLASVPLAYSLALVDLGLITLGILGVYTRVTLGLATVVSLYVFGLPQNQGKIDHYHHVVWFMALLAAGPSARFLSFDALRAALRGADRGLVEPSPPPGAALTTFRYIWLLFGLLYLMPGLAKLEKALTAGWASPENIRAILWSSWQARWLYQTGFSQPTWMNDLPGPILTLAGVAAIGFEVAFIVLVFVRVVRPWLAVAGYLFHRANRLALGIGFGFLTPAYVGLFDWAAIGRGLHRRLAGDRLVVLYDGDCRLCRRAIAIVRSLDLCDALEAVAAGSPRRRDFPALTDEMLAHDLYVVAPGQTASGYDAYVKIASRIPFLWPLALVMRVPAVARVGGRLYRRVADTRACAIAPVGATPATPARPTGWLTVIGLALVIGQTTVSTGQFTANLIGDRRAVAWWSKLAWPFDHYPRFADTKVREEVEAWEPRVVSADGRETRISPQAFQRAFGHPSKSIRVTRDVLFVRDPAEQRRRSLDLVRVLWTRERPETRAGAAEVRVYFVVYRLGPGPPALVSERLLDRFAIDELATQRAGDRRVRPGS